jgi:hypothetical protein
MVVDIENPGCVAAPAEESRRSMIKEKLVALFLRNPNGAAGGDGDNREAEPPHGVGGEAAEPVQSQCGWRICVLYVCSAISFIAAFTCATPQIGDDIDGIVNRQHLVVGLVGVIVGLPLSACLLIAALWQSYSEPRLIVKDVEQAR